MTYRDVYRKKWRACREDACGTKRLRCAGRSNAEGIHAHGLRRSGQEWDFFLLAIFSDMNVQNGATV